MTALLDIPGYRVERMLAKGGMAEVFLAEQLSLGRRVAIKLLDTTSHDPEFAERFLHEARLVAALNHSNLITIYDFGQLSGGKLFLSMEFLQGGDLEERLARGLNEAFTLNVLRQLGSVLRFVHGNGIIHRDIKPANILFRQDDTLVLTDFGIAKKINNDVGLTQAGMVVGSAGYGSPEQMQGLDLDQRSDIYSLGVLLLEMLTGKNPFKADSFVNTAMNHIQMDIPRLQGNQARFQPLLDKMLAKKPKDRFASMDLLLASLDAIAPVTGSHPAAVVPDASVTVRDKKLPAEPSQTKDRVLPASHGINTRTEPHVNLFAAKPAATLDTFDLDDFQAEAMKLLAETEQSLNTPLPSAKKYSGELRIKGNSASGNTSGSHPVTKKPPPTATDKRENRYINVRTRPLPDNLLDD